MVDYYSNYMETAKLENTPSKTVIAHVKYNIARYGIVDVLISDNGPRFTSQEFNEFDRQYEFEYKTSSPTYARSNGLAERAVQTMKSILTKAKNKYNKDPYLAILDHLNTPPTNDIGSPAQRLIRIRTKPRLPK